MKENVSYWKFFKSFWTWKEEVSSLKFIVAVTLVLVLIAQGHVEYPDNVESVHQIGALLILWAFAIGLFYTILLTIKLTLTTIFTILLGIELFFESEASRNYYDVQVRKETYEEWKK